MLLTLYNITDKGGDKMFTQADLDQIVQDAQGLDALIASLEEAAQKVLDAEVPTPTDPATHEDVAALGDKLDALTAAVKALTDAQVVPSASPSEPAVV